MHAAVLLLLLAGGCSCCVPAVLREASATTVPALSFPSLTFFPSFCSSLLASLLPPYLTFRSPHRPHPPSPDWPHRSRALEPQACTRSPSCFPRHQLPKWSSCVWFRRLSHILPQGLPASRCQHDSPKPRDHTTFRALTDNSRQGSPRKAPHRQLGMRLNRPFASTTTTTTRPQTRYTFSLFVCLRMWPLLSLLRQRRSEPVRPF